MTRTRGYLIGYGLACLGVWLVPFFMTGWTKRSWDVFPRWWSFQHSAAGLFTRRTPVWWDHHLEVQRADRSRYEVDERAHFPMGAFGYRTRYDRIMNESNHNRAALEVRRRIANYVLERERARATNSRSTLHVRLVRSFWKVGSPEMSQPAGSWSPPPVAKLASGQRTLLGGYSLGARGFSPFWEDDGKNPLGQPAATAQTGQEGARTETKRETKSPSEPSRRLLKRTPMDNITENTDKKSGNPEKDEKE